jgi:hypothetical protein
VLCPAVDSAAIALRGRRRGAPRLLGGQAGRPSGRLIAKSGTELHDDVEQLQAVHVSEAFQVLVHVGVVQFADQLRQPLLPALQEPVCSGPIIWQGQDFLSCQSTSCTYPVTNMFPSIIVSMLLYTWTS